MDSGSRFARPDRRQQLSPVVAGHGDVEHQARLDRDREPHRRELRGAADAAALGQHAAARADLAVEMAAQRSLALLAQPPGAVLDRRRRATCGMRAAGVPGRGENGKTWSCVSPHSSTRSSERSNIASVSVGKPAMMSPPNATSGRSRRTSVAEGDGVGARVAALHALEDHVVAGLQRQMQMRHQPRVVGERIEQIGVGLDRVDRGQPQALELRHARAGFASPGGRGPARSS